MPASEASEEHSKAPDGGARAWLVALGAACTYFPTLGFTNSFGVFEQYYGAHQLRGESPDQIAWIGSLSALLRFATGTVAGPMFDRYGAWIIYPAAVLYVVGMMMTSLCRTYWELMLAQGVLMGAAQGFLQYPATAAVSQYFDKKRAAALAVAISGSSIGGVVLPLALSRMLNNSSLGYGASVRIIGYITIAMLLFACLVVKARLPPRKTDFFIWSAFKKPQYLLLVLSLFFMIFGMFTPLFYIPTYAVSRGIDPTLASYLLAIVNAGSTFGRIISGILADKYGQLNIFSLAGVSTGIILLCLTAAKSTAGLVVYSIAIGFWSGAILTGGSGALTLCPNDPREFGTYLGMGLAVGSVSALIGPPINGALVNEYGGFLQVSIFNGVMCLAGGVIAFATKSTTPQGLFGRT